MDKKEYQKEYRKRPKVIAKTKVRKKEYHKEYLQKPEVKVRRKEYMKEYYKRPEAKAKLKEYQQRPETKVRRKEYHKEYRERPEVKVRLKEYMKEYLQKPYVKLKTKEYDKERHQRPEVKARKKEYLQRLEVKARVKEYYKNLTPEIKARNKEYMKEYYKQISKIENKRRKKLGLKLVGEGYTSQQELYIYVKNLLGDVKIKTNKFKTLNGLQLDIYIPSLKLAFEYQGRQHYIYPTFFHRTREEFEEQQERDIKKKELCEERGITLIEVNYQEKLSESLVIKKLNENNIETKQVCLV